MTIASLCEHETNQKYMFKNIVRMQGMGFGPRGEKGARLCSQTGYIISASSHMCDRLVICCVDTFN